MVFTDINWLAILVAAIASFAVAGVWYGALFQKAWRDGAHLTDEQLSTGQQRVFALSFLTLLISAATLSYFIGDGDLLDGLRIGVIVGVGFVAMVLAMNLFFERQSGRLFAVNAGYNVISFVLMGAIIGQM